MKKSKAKKRPAAVRNAFAEQIAQIKLQLAKAATDKKTSIQDKLSILAELRTK